VRYPKRRADIRWLGGQQGDMIRLVHWYSKSLVSLTRGSVGIPELSGNPEMAPMVGTSTLFAELSAARKSGPVKLVSFRS
jgi:hypothetical protein